MNALAFLFAGVVFDCVGVFCDVDFEIVGVVGVDGFGELANGFDMGGGGLDISGLAAN